MLPTGLLFDVTHLNVITRLHRYVDLLSFAMHQKLTVNIFYVILTDCTIR